MQAQPNTTEIPSGTLQMRTTAVFEANWALQDKRLVLNEGGTRSSKTISIAQKYICKLVADHGKDWRGSIVRKTLPALRATAMRDTIGLLKEYGLYRKQNHNKTENTYKFTYTKDGKLYTNELEFFSADDEQKVRGRERDDLWMNEANELGLDEFRQLVLRTKGQVTMDYNPVDDYHWINEQVKNKRTDYALIKSNYRDNTFLTREVVAEIEALQDADENYWRVFGLGEKPVNGTRIFTHWKLVDEMPVCDEYIYGVDFGFNNASAIVKVGIKDGVYYWQELFYTSHFTNQMLIQAMNDLVEAGHITKDMTGYGDSEDSNRIREIQEAGFNIIGADKEAGSVRNGILHIKSKQWYITKDSLNLIDNAKSYMWKTKGEKVLDEPVKANDHALDAGRMAVWTHCGKGSNNEPRIRVL